MSLYTAKVQGESPSEPLTSLAFVLLLIISIAKIRINIEDVSVSFSPYPSYPLISVTVNKLQSV